MIAKKPEKSIEDFIRGVISVKEVTKQSNLARENIIKFLLKLPNDLHRQLKIEAINKGITLNDYIIQILENRQYRS